MEILRENFLIFLYLPVLLFAVVVHEVAHAWVARREGDRTAEREGRITLNPLPHLDLWGSLIIPVALFLSPGNFIFGWAKPVPVDPSNFRNYKWGEIRVSLAGIAANLLFAFACTLLLAVFLGWSPPCGAAADAATVAADVARFGIFINLILAVFNLVPIPPLDGSHVVAQLLPARWVRPYRKFGRYGLIAFLLAVFFVPDFFGVILWPVRVLMDAAYGFVSLWI